MKKTVLAIVCLLLLAACAPQQPTGPTKPYGQPSAAGEGRAVFTITDAAANMQSVTSVKVTVDSVRVHSAAKGWVTVSSSAKTYDLLQLKASATQEILADAKLDADTYQQVRLDISKVVVVDASGEHEAKLPSGELKIVGQLVVEADSTSTATFDFIADESLHVTGKGEYIMTPVIQLETKTNAEVEVKAGNKVEIRGGNVKTNVKVSMDIAGNVGVGLKVGLDEELEIDGGIISVKARMIGETKGKGTAQSESSAGANASVESETSVSVGTGGVGVTG